MQSDKKAFILPFVVLLTAALMVVVTLLLNQAQFEFTQTMMHSARQRARICLKMNIDPLITELEKVLSNEPAATFLMQQVADGTRVHATGILSNEGKQVLSSSQPAGTTDFVYFASSFSSHVLQSGKIDMDSVSNSPAYQIAWSFEDISLTAADRTAAGWWPLPEWQMSVSAQPAVGEMLQLAGVEESDIFHIQKTSPLPYSPDGAFPLVPVLRQAKLKFGVFASGISGQREKVIRIRFYLECSIWNPYNRPIQFHTRAGSVPVFQLVFRNLPLLRIINQSNGMQSGWIDIDTIRNSQSGTRGIHAWIRLKDRLQPGETISVLEPDEKYQPEGLARIVHPAFMVSPADHIRIEFKAKDQGISLTCLQLDATDPVSSAESSSEWLEYNQFMMAFPTLDFPRADEPENPFYLESGSLSFRQDHTQLEIAARLQEQPFLDARMLHVSADVAYPDARGSLVQGSQLVEFTVGKPPQVPHSGPVTEPWPALVSWPATELRQLMDLADLPHWENAFCIGSKDSVSLNSVLNTYWPFAQAEHKSKETGSARILRYVQSIHINSPQTKSWMDLLQGNGTTPDTTKTAFLAMYPNPITEEDYLEIDEISLMSIAGRLANRAISDPAHSISDFFNRGTLAAAIPAVADKRIHRLLPLRALQGKGYQPASHGNAFILHAACFIRHNGEMRPATARIWLLQVPDKSGKKNLRITRFEWTDSQQHLVRIK